MKISKRKKVLSHCEALRYMCNNKNKKKPGKTLFFFMSSLQTYHRFKLDFQKLDRHIGGKWLIHRIKRRKDNLLQSLELPLNAELLRKILLVICTTGERILVSASSVNMIYETVISAINLFWVIQYLYV